MVEVEWNMRLKPLVDVKERRKSEVKLEKCGS